MLLTCCHFRCIFSFSQVYYSTVLYTNISILKATFNFCVFVFVCLPFADVPERCNVLFDYLENGEAMRWVQSSSVYKGSDEE